MGMLMRRHRKKAEPIGPNVPKGAPSKSWKVDELRAFAAVSNIDLRDAKTKDEILAILESAKDDTTPPPSGDDETTAGDTTTSV